MDPSIDSKLTKGARIRKLRTLLNLTQSDFAAMLSRSGTATSQHYISALERGDRNLGPDVQSRIEDRFAVRRQWLEQGLGDVFIAPLSGSSTTDQSGPIQIEPVRNQNEQTSTSTPPKVGNLIWISSRDHGLFLRTGGQAPTLPRSEFPLLVGQGYAIEIQESAMLPDFTPGSYVITTRLDSSDDMVIGRPYVVQTADRFFLGIFDRRSANDLSFVVTYPVPRSGFTLLPSGVVCIHHIEMKIVR